MSERATPVERHLAQLKAEFDRSFAEAPAAAERSDTALLRLSVRGDRLALRVADVRGLHPCRGLVPVPSTAPEALGVVGMRGSLVPVFSLARLAGYGVEPEPPLWLVLCGEDPLGLAFAHFEGHVVVPATAVREIPATQTRSPHLTQLVTLSGEATLVLSIPSVLRTLTERGAASRESQP